MTVNIFDAASAEQAAAAIIRQALPGTAGGGLH
jgi:hypothetical protein